MRMHAGLLAATFTTLLVTGLLFGGCSASSRADAGPAPVAQADASIGTCEGCEACLDRWLAEHKLDPYGQPEGTMYAGGDPTFDEATGQRTPRAEQIARIFQRHPAARAACAAPGSDLAPAPAADR